MADALTGIEPQGGSIMMLFQVPQILWIAGGIAAALIFALMFGTVVIGAQESGLVTKKYGRPLPPGRMFATRGEAGDQAVLLPPGLHFPLWRWKYSVR